MRTWHLLLDEAIFLGLHPRETLSSYCWSPDWSPTDCCFFAPAAPGQFLQLETVRCFVRVQGNMSSLWWFTQLFVLGWVVGFRGKTHLILTRNKKIVSGKKTWRPCDGTVSICVTEQRNTEYFGDLVVKYMTHTEGTYRLMPEFFADCLVQFFLCWLVLQLIGSRNQQIWLWN